MEYTESLCSPRPRLFKKPFNYRHLESPDPKQISHGSVRYLSNGKDIIPQIGFFFQKHGKMHGIKGAYMSHDKTHRSKMRVDMDYLYYENVPNR